MVKRGIRMKQNKISFVIIRIIFFSLFFFSVGNTENSSSDWVEYTRSKGLIFLYNTVSIKHLTKDIVQVWDKSIYSDEAREKEIQSLIEYGSSTTGYDKLSQKWVLHEIDCKKHRLRMLSIIEYDTDSNVLYSDSIEREWDYLPPDSIWDTLRKKVCE